MSRWLYIPELVPPSVSASLTVDRPNTIIYAPSTQRLYVWSGGFNVAQGIVKINPFTDAVSARVDAPPGTPVYFGQIILSGDGTKIYCPCFDGGATFSVYSFDLTSETFTLLDTTAPYAFERPANAVSISSDSFYVSSYGSGACPFTPLFVDLGAGGDYGTGLGGGFLLPNRCPMGYDVNLNRVYIAGSANGYTGIKSGLPSADPNIWSAVTGIVDDTVTEFTYYSTLTKLYLLGGTNVYLLNGLTGSVAFNNGGTYTHTTNMVVAGNGRLYYGSGFPGGATLGIYSYDPIGEVMIAKCTGTPTVNGRGCYCPANNCVYFPNGATSGADQNTVFKIPAVF